ncbi:related to aflatoxin B1 aldehyde reductase [Phialocephala subalpina]|uniref:Related to aflatoxin B1 aldehyde reductase n=1 Tax=Phialocephala subalpina TaxID=576137 RepID=A0A1L7WL48_9HELO|nr:related to aflatoxin B1 aldehyde reductase [Phialocephala subalpina]
MPPTLLFGAGGIGEGNISHTWTNVDETSSLLDDLEELGLTQLDSAASYPPGAPWTTERLLGETKAAKRGFLIDTKVLATEETVDGSLSEAKIDESVKKSLELLGVKQVNILFAHAPDPKTPAEETAKAFDRYFRAGTIKQLGLSNYNTEQMKDYLEVCEAKGYQKPTIYQGHYNAICRQHEFTLFPLLRAHGIKIFAFGPLAGGFLTGKVSIPSPGTDLTGGRWTPGGLPAYPKTFDKPVLHDAMKIFMDKCKEKGLSSTEVSLRWIMHHSELGEGDGIILGATKVTQLKGNVEFCRKGRLDEGLVEACEELWGRVRGEMEATKLIYEEQVQMSG